MRIRAGCRVPYGSPLGAKISHPGARFDCWRWKGAKNGEGYGCVKLNGKVVLAHREVYRRCHGELPDGFDVHHECFTRDCVNPYHLTPLLSDINRWLWERNRNDGSDTNW